jgi:hypothetical protein
MLSTLHYRRNASINFEMMRIKTLELFTDITSKSIQKSCPETF